MASINLIDVFEKPDRLIDVADFRSHRLHFYRLYMKTFIGWETIDESTGQIVPEQFATLWHGSKEYIHYQLNTIRKMNPHNHFQMRKVKSWRIIQ